MDEKNVKRLRKFLDWWEKKDFLSSSSSSTWRRNFLLPVWRKKRTRIKRLRKYKNVFYYFLDETINAKQLSHGSKHNSVKLIKQVMLATKCINYIVISNIRYRGAAIAQCMRLCIPSCCLEFESQARHLCFYHLGIICAIFVMWKEQK